MSDLIKIDAPELLSIEPSRAKRLRLDIAKVRIETDKLRKAQKEEFLRAGKAIDGVSNILKWAVVEKENKLKEIEEFFERQEQARIDALQVERVAKISKYIDDAEDRNLGSMNEDVWRAFYSQKKQAYKDQIEAEREAKKKQKEREKREREERERMRKENERLKKEAEERERKALEEQKERERLQRIEQEKREKEEAERRKKEEEERKKMEDKLRKEREERERAERELKERQERERQEAEEKEAAFQAELSKQDADKVNDLVNDLQVLKSKYTFESAKNQEMYKSVGQLLDKVVTFIEE